MELSGTAVLLSAAAHHGWAVKWQPRQPQIAVADSALRDRTVTKDELARAVATLPACGAEAGSRGWAGSTSRTPP